ncbi:hypothetical protein TL16_g00882 [Triparma laevis f. inornata]|uniref:SAP domain-containing protein n=2 Tax=Triparma laevis TaxID=1534972 RepID=A0A9W7CEW2_9STRA|nr:hypothetical protein TL16_g00882 [Triparma laevis f. inornata]GMI04851.1 hypothetical protein TrLO_g15115 [Triparma laevis f. longispina]
MKCTVKQLKAECESNGLPTTGKKAELVSRLTSHTPKRGRSKSPAKGAKKAATPKKSPSQSRSKSTSRSSSKIAKTTKSSSSAAGAPPAAPPHCVLFEKSARSANDKGLLSEDGATHIQLHQYVAGGNTSFDNFMNPHWNNWVNMLPIWMAPNLVTTCGGAFCLLSFSLFLHYSPNLDSEVPWWVFLVSGFCTWAYYTLDCLDGKQARRTGSSSPLGQLFDHGVDCIGNLAHFTAIGSCLASGPTRTTLAGQVALQFSFFVAQWQEYHTRELPHKFGEVGVTECNHLQAITTIVFGVLAYTGTNHVEMCNSEAYFGLTWAEFVIYAWIFQCFCLICISFNMTVFSTGNYKSLQHLISPFLACWYVYLIPDAVLASNFRMISLASGFLFSFITNKMIVYSMAKMTFATLQLDVVPLLVLSWLSSGTGLTAYGIKTAWQGLFIWQFLRVIYWSARAINQLCAKLGIKCFRIPPVKSD